MIYNEEEIRNDYRKLTKKLIEKNLYITTMESATSGLVASLITDTEGASAIMKGAFITYSNEAKIMQGVPEDIINKYSVYSRETVIAMANACKNTYKADIGIGISGTMGNVDPGNSEYSTPGDVYFAISYKDKTEAYNIQLELMESRYMYKLAVAKEVYEKIMRMI